MDLAQNHVTPSEADSPHWTAFYLLIIGGARLLPAAWIMQVIPLGLGIIYLSVALRKVYAQGVVISLAKSLILLFGFLIILAVWVGSAIAVGLVVT